LADVLKPAFAGSFYPGEKHTLETMVRGFLDCGCSAVDDAVGIVVPHAGYVYSGITAGHGFASAPDNVSTVVVCAPSHRYPIFDSAVFDVDGIETPLGLCGVNRRITGSLLEEIDPVLFHEHSFEVMVPFIQIRWPDALIVPIILGASPDCERIAGIVHRVAPDAFFIASSDLSHFHPLETAEILDRKVIEGFLSLSPDEFTRQLTLGGEACGRYPILALLYLARLKKAKNAVRLHYSTSADAGGDIDRVVGYFSGLVSK
jgi:AmmeMemoRadiSam system protein B